MDVHVLPVEWDTDKAELRAIRGAVFIEEQGVPREIEWDGEDDLAHHFMAINEAGQRVGCGRLLPSGKIGRMAVLPPYRGQGIGRKILDAAIDRAQKLGFNRVTLHAQTPVVDFYRKAGFLPEGGEFMEAGIPHQAMSLTLAIPFEAPTDVPAVVVQQAPVAEETPDAEFHQYDGELSCIRGLLTFLESPSRTIRIYSQDLDHALFDRSDVIDALSAFVRHGAPARLQVLIHSSYAIVSRGHQLLELARRLDSKITIRRVSDDLATDRASFVLSDEHGYFLLPDHREYQAMANAYDPVQAGRLAERFDYLWDRSESDPELRVLRL
jgi:predicted GNAT family N-acyltransferase